MKIEITPALCEIVARYVDGFVFEVEGLNPDPDLKSCFPIITNTDIKRATQIYINSRVHIAYDQRDLARRYRKLALSCKTN